MSDSGPIRTGWGASPSLDDIAAMAQEALDNLDEPFRTLAREVAIQVQDLPDQETLEALHIESPYELTGLYFGAPLPSEQYWRPSWEQPPIISLYRLSILVEWATTDDIALDQLVRQIAVEKFGNHIGLSNAVIEMIDERDD